MNLKFFWIDWNYSDFLTAIVKKYIRLPGLMDKSIFIDETGDLGQFGSRYFIVTAVWADSSSVFDRIKNKLRRGIFRKELSTAQEIKANKSSNNLIISILGMFSKIESTRAQSIILDKHKLRLSYANKDKLYNYVCGYLSNIAIDSNFLDIRVDRTKGKQLLIDEFNTYMEEKFREVKWARKIKITHSWSQSWAGLQIADVVSWAVFQKFEHNNDYFAKLIEKKLTIFHIVK